MKKQSHLPEVGFVRLPTVLALIPVSKSAWWAGITEGRFPKPVKLGLRTTAWRVEDIRDVIEHGVQLLGPEPEDATPTESLRMQPKGAAHGKR